MQLITILALLYLCCEDPTGVFANDAFNGWKTLPKSAVVEKFRRSGEEVERRIDRGYHYSSGKLDSIIDIDDDSKHVHTHFKRLSKLVRVNALPWDYSLAPTRTRFYKRSGKNNWTLAGITHDSLDSRDRLVLQSHIVIDSLGQRSIGYRSTRAYDSQGYLLRETSQYGEKTKSVNSSYLSFDAQGRISSIFEIDSSGIDRGYRSIDTTARYHFAYKEDSDLLTVLARMEIGSTSELINLEVLLWGDSVAEFTLLPTLAGEVFLVPNRYVFSAVISENEGPTRMFTAQIDDRYRLIRAGYLDSNVTTATYYDDNYVREVQTISEGKLVRGIKNIRTYEEGGRVLTQETQELLAFSGEGKYRTRERITYYY